MRFKKTLQIYGLSAVGAVSVALTYIAMMYFALPVTDLAFKEGLLNVIRDPFVLSVAFFWSIVFSLVSFPIIAWSFWKKNLIIAGIWIICVPNVIVIALINVIGFGSIAAAALGLIATCILCHFKLSDRPALPLS
jgi:hypothetical protein